MKTKTFDCVKMKHRGGDRIYEQIKGLTLDQKIEYWKRRSQEVRREQEQLVRPPRP